MKYKGSGFREWRRKIPRMEVPEGITITVDLEFEDGTTCSAKCLNLNQSGLLVEILPKHLNQVKAEKKILLSLTLKNEKTGMMPGIIRRCDGCQVGIILPDAATRTTKQNDHLHSIMRIVERERLRLKTQGAFE